MNEGYYISLAGGLAQQAYIDVAANNMANISTTGFKRDVAVFQLNPTETEKVGLRYPRMFTINRLSEKQGGGAEYAEIRTNFAQGGLEQTENKLDLAIAGQGFFAVQNDANKTFYTRSGNFTLNSKGEMVMNISGTGQIKLLGEDGQPIVLPAQTDANTLTISEDGRIGYLLGGASRQLPSRVAIYGFDGEPRKVGSNLFEAKQIVGLLPSETAPRDLKPELINNIKESKLHQGYLEGSNAEPVRQMLDLMQGSRLFEANLNFLRQQDQTLARLTNDVGRSPA